MISRLRLRHVLLTTMLCGIVPAVAQQSTPQPLDDKSVVLTADRVDYDQNSQIVTASGEVELTREGKRLLARQVTWNRKTGEMTAEGNVVLINTGGEILFGDRMEVTEELREGFIQKVGVLLPDDSRLAANTGRRTGGNTTVLNRAVYSPCPLCADPNASPLWQIKSRTVTHDQAAQEVTYKDAVFDMFGIPVMYLPTFSHPDPTVKRRSGFLRPKYGIRTGLGAFVQVPYYYTISPSQDFTIAPMITTQQNVALFGEYRRMTEHGPMILNGSATYADKYAGSEGTQTREAFRGHFEGYGRFEYDEGYGSGFDAAIASDDTYLRRYNISKDNILTNHAWVDRSWDTNYAYLDALYFQGLLSYYDPGQIPVALPRGAVHYRMPAEGLGGYWDMDASMLALTRGEGLDTRRLSGTVGWTRPVIGKYGDVWKFGLSARADGYQTEGNPEDYSDEGGGNATGRFYPLASAEWSYPLIKVSDSGWQHLIEPVVAGYLSPYGGNPDDIPNEDSLSFDFDDTNLFQANRFTGLDRVEGGPRGSYGIRFGSFSPDNFQISGMVGQSWTYKKNTAFAAGTGLNDNFSDVVGRLEMRPAEWLDLTYRFRIDNEFKAINKNDLLASFGTQRLRFGVGYLSLADDPDFDTVRERKELTLSVRAGVTENLTLSAGVRQDMVEDEPVTYAAGLVYTHPCLILVAGLERDYTSDRDAGPSTTLLLRVTFKNLGEVGGRTSLSSDSTTN